MALNRRIIAASLLFAVAAPLTAGAQDIPWQCSLYQQQIEHLERQKGTLTERIRVFEASKVNVNKRYDDLVAAATSQRDSITQKINQTQWRHNTLNNLCVNGYDPETGRSVRGWRKRSQRRRICKTRETVQGTLNRFNNNAEAYSASIAKYENLRSQELAKINEQIADVQAMIATFDSEIANNRYSFDFCVQHGGTVLPTIKLSSVTFEELQRGSVYHVGDSVTSGQSVIAVQQSLLNDEEVSPNPDANGYVGERLDNQGNLSKNLMANDATLSFTFSGGVKRISFDLWAPMQQEFAIQVDNLLQARYFVEDLSDTDAYQMMVTPPSADGGSYRVEIVSAQEITLFAVAGMGVTIDNVFLFGD